MLLTEGKSKAGEGHQSGDGGIDDAPPHCFVIRGRTLFSIFCRARTSGGGGEGWNHTAHRHCDGGPLDRGYAAVVPASLSLCDVVQRRPVRSPTRSHKGSQEIGANVRLMSPALSESGPLAGAPMTAGPGRSLSANVSAFSGIYTRAGRPDRALLAGITTQGWSRFLGTCREQRGTKQRSLAVFAIHPG
ncbi:hypothetical protein CPLU01_05189 [Colletotrichum plurivorum]|uniref:Uncharacterized protein n=1 Tax=Colletotrichum plurivorum TaxID=2175906 RepID=A0A8H6KNM6_9PEZI|nr:hypothetical protein CPLU01_05189 [Colletotrichum plurivorum]